MKDHTLNYETFTKGYYGERLLREHSLDEVGVWLVYGEDPNPDFGGSHIQPLIGIYEGQLKNVVHTAVDLPNFWEWGAGGRIEKREVKKV